MPWLAGVLCEVGCTFFGALQKQLKETVAELLRVYLKGKYPLKRDDDITGIIKKRMAGHILEEEFVDIIKYMYNRDDSVAILLRLNDTREKQLMEYIRFHISSPLKIARICSHAN